MKAHDPITRSIIAHWIVPPLAKTRRNGEPAEEAKEEKEDNSAEHDQECDDYHK